MNMNLVKSFIGDVPLEGLKYIDIYWGNDIMVSAPNGGIFEYVTQSHSHPVYFFAIFTHQNNYMKVNNNILKVKPNNVFVLSPGVIHSEIPIDVQSRYLVVAVQNEKMKELANLFKFNLSYYEGIFFEDTENLLTYIFEYINESEAKPHIDKVTLLNLEKILLNKIIKILSTNQGTQVSEILSKETEVAVKHIFDNLSDNITVEDLASVTNLSKSSFSKKFKADLDITPIRYINKVRMEKSSFLIIENKLSIKEIASLCGFSNVSHFSNAFKKYFGLGPREYSARYK